MTLRVSGGRRLQSPPGSTARPTSARVRLAVMNLLAAEIPGSRWLDLCCGSGVMACEALQRGASHVMAVERDRRIAAVARSNLVATLGGREVPEGAEAQRVQVAQADVLRWLATRRSAAPPISFDLIYVDPPYAAGLHGPIAAAVRSGRWMAPGGTLLWECASDGIPPDPPGWQRRDCRRYGGTTLVLLQELPAQDGTTHPEGSIP
ncbi:16S rRNA (guanine(966)-N(2))-methyltransferase RsmD [Synechococcus sp. CS-1332]|uniref:16S rRNA (guanine(966)-N(2))-methyltransferase RsmD n=1 Tax=Synechococcus sp. CS-1332 TaxID=2847972 RepID=UPI00223C0773|nr:16S rRNA (guanine(966)-N(2))-methyltransferase RsmD [Synechococcus sp. CS-1332]MCT0207354.1 16S rRNA (guanine(966)-N(2))-methyltransferase RsmD [Synechococcus sp. CS-1332]